MIAMDTLTPSADRIGAALKALRQTHSPVGGGEDELALGAKCLRAVAAQLAEEGVPKVDLQPLFELETRLNQMLAPAAKKGANQRRRLPPSEALLARVSALIDLLIKGGSDEAKAARTAMRRLVASGVPAPAKGGDARGWKRLLEWRTNLANGLVSEAARQEYLDFTSEIEQIPPAEREQRVLDERLWDRRRKRR
jgi:hypothetical protein